LPIGFEPLKSIVDYLVTLASCRFRTKVRGVFFMAYFFFKLVPPRPSFPQDMTEAEGELMKRHAAYWQSLLDKGFVLVFGPVLDPKGP